ncbi:MAG TPA: MlaD family protein, partial [Rhabdaerophilum sp.]|nr:MlaD family protein [Rhabdaerophilum sp.]
MENRANYALVGLFTLAVIAGAFAFVYWFKRAGEQGDRRAYRVVFSGSVSGLSKGSVVRFNGLRVGEVTDMEIMPSDPSKVVAVI